MHHAVVVETEVHDRKWSFVIGPSSSVITTLSRKATSAITDLLLFTTKRANAIKTLLYKTLSRKNFVKLSAKEKDQYISYMNMSRHYISDYVVTLTPYSEDVNETVKSNRNPTALFHNVSNYDLFVWMHYYAARDTNITWHGQILSLRMTGRGFLPCYRLYMLAWGKKPCRKLVTMKNFTLPYWDWTGSKTQCDPAICFEQLLGVTNQVDGTVKGKYFDNWYVICSNEQFLLPDEDVWPNEQETWFNLERIN